MNLYIDVFITPCLLIYNYRIEIKTYYGVHAFFLLKVNIIHLKTNYTFMTIVL